MSDERVELSASSAVLVSLGFVAVGLLMAATPWLMYSSDRGSYAEALAQQSWVAGDCTVGDAHTVEIEEREEKVQRLQVEFTLVADGHTYPNRTYLFAGSPGRTLAPGMQIDCFYDPASPEGVTLQQKSLPKEGPPAIGLLHVFFTLLGAAMAIVGGYWLVRRKRLSVGDVPGNL